MAAAGDWFGFEDDLGGGTVTDDLWMPLSVLGLENSPPTTPMKLDCAGNSQGVSANVIVSASPN